MDGEEVVRQPAASLATTGRTVAQTLSVASPAFRSSAPPRWIGLTITDVRIAGYMIGSGGLAAGGLMDLIK